MADPRARAHEQVERVYGSGSSVRTVGDAAAGFVAEIVEPTGDVVERVWSRHETELYGAVVEHFNKRAPRLSDAEIVSAMKASGYPFEIELLKAFDDGGMDPMIGFRLRVSDGPVRPAQADDEPDEAALTREVDVLAQITTSAMVDRPDDTSQRDVIRCTLRAFVEAKRLDAYAAFVGLPWKQPDPQSKRSLRCRFAGCPSYGVGLGREAEAFLWDGGFAAALDPLNEIPFCVQWAVVRKDREKSGSRRPLEANHDQKIWRSMDSLVRGLQRHDEDTDAFFQSLDHFSVAILFGQPTIIFRTPTLFLYNAETDTLTRTDALTLERRFEVRDTVVTRLIDVVSLGGLPKLIERYKSAADRLQKSAESNGRAIIAAAEEQRVRRRREVADATFAQVYARGGFR